jgi:hypothetical protein
MASAYYDINAQQHSTFNFHVEYYDNSGNAVDLSDYSVRLQVRPNYDSNKIYLSVSNSGVTSGGTIGEFGETGGIGGSGGAAINTGETGSAFTGGILFTADATSMGYVRVGSWKYSIDLTKGVTTEELMQGQFIVSPKITR